MRIGVTADVGSGRGPVSVTGPAIIVWRILTNCVFDGIDGLVHCWFDVSNDLDEEWGVGLGAACFPQFLDEIVQRPLKFIDIPFTVVEQIVEYRKPLAITH